MHDTAYSIGSKFLELYATATCGHVIEIGSRNVNGTLRACLPGGYSYTGIDIEPGDNVDVVIAPGSPLPVSDQSADVVIASSALEHDGAFWDTFVDLSRMTKEGGFIYFNAPSNGEIHRYPVDCWRFYPDAAVALARLACARGVEMAVVESFTANREADMYNDFVAVFTRAVPRPRADCEFLHSHFSVRNVYRFDRNEFLYPSGPTEDMQLLAEATRALLRLADAAERRQSAARPLSGGRVDLLADAAERRQSAAEAASTPVSATLFNSPEVRRIAKMLGGELARELEKLTTEDGADGSFGPFDPLFRMIECALRERSPLTEDVPRTGTAMNNGTSQTGARPESWLGNLFRFFRRSPEPSTTLAASEPEPRPSVAAPRLEPALRTSVVAPEPSAPTPASPDTGSESDDDSVIVIEGVRLTPLQYRSLYDDLIKAIPEDKPELALRHYQQNGRREIAENRRAIPQARLAQIRQQQLIRE